MKARTAINLNFAKMLVPLALIVSLAGGLGYTSETQADGKTFKPPTYDVAAIKPSKPGDQSLLLFRPGRFTASGMTLRSMIEQAYGIEDDQIISSTGLGSYATF